MGPPDPDGEIGRYSTIHYREIRRILDRLDLRPHDVFVDVGSGKGRVLSVAVRYGCEVMGVEYDAELAESLGEPGGARRDPPGEGRGLRLQRGDGGVHFRPGRAGDDEEGLAAVGGCQDRFVNPTPASVESCDRFGYEVYDRWERRETHPVLFFKKL